MNEIKLGIVEARFADIEKVIPLILAGEFEKAMCQCNG